MVLGICQEKQVKKSDSLGWGRLSLVPWSLCKEAEQCTGLNLQSKD